MAPPLVRKSIAEFIGTLALVFAILSAVNNGDYTNVVFTHGLAIFIIGGLLGSVSGAHLNPAVTLVVFLRNCLKFQVKHVIASRDTYRYLF